MLQRKAMYKGYRSGRAGTPIVDDQASDSSTNLIVAPASFVMSLILYPQPLETSAKPSP